MFLPIYLQRFADNLGRLKSLAQDLLGPDKSLSPTCRRTSQADLAALHLFVRVGRGEYHDDGE